jgi:hypothetical protein
LDKKNFFNAVVQNYTEFMYWKLEITFLRINDVKIIEGVFVGPQIGELIQAIKSEGRLSAVEKKQNGNHSKMTLPIAWEIKRQTNNAIWWLILYSGTKL